jgi:hypothetical protein
MQMPISEEIVAAVRDIDADVQRAEEDVHKLYLRTGVIDELSQEFKTLQFHWTRHAGMYRLVKDLLNIPRQ